VKNITDEQKSRILDKATRIYGKDRAEELIKAWIEGGWFGAGMKHRNEFSIFCGSENMMDVLLSEGL
jgi:hypothetical protein